MVARGVTPTHEHHDLRAWGAGAEAAMAERVAQACEQLGSAGRSIGN
jgi:fructose-bisphosphate aldolase class II